ncbi:carboxylate transporter [Rothia nasimurium]|uniref:Sodium-dependent dicarboxylate transporter SdcS n=1 Tax=Rothia nasimurium TaxID=85336 RepID=A0A1Y1RSD9_9MICC|nr:MULTISPECIES: DASS family sodium-coupled anion symporter [Rothia]ORC24943.1 carboxylate transporter [Rothia nasimurium]
MEKPHITGDHLQKYSAAPTQSIDQIHRSRGSQAPEVEPGERKKRLIGLFGGLLAAALTYVIMPEEVPDAARLTAATAVLMGAWWMTEALPIPATALLPLVIFPVFNAEVEINDIGASYGNNIIFLFMGGFLLALAMQRWNLHRRIALLTLTIMGTKPSMMVAGFMVATGFLSMWVSNTATAVMMIPIGVSVLMLIAQASGTTAIQIGDAATPDSEEVKQAVIKSDFGTALMLGIAYAASIGSLGTLIGTPPNTLLAGYMADTHGVHIGFGQWMLVGVPLSAVVLFFCWFLLTKVLFKPEIDEIPGGKKLIANEYAKLGAMSAGEVRVLIIFIAAALAWIFVPIIWPESTPITDAGIAVAVGLLLFALPAGGTANKGVRLIDWETATKLPWGVLLLFGGGLALSGQFTSSGLTKWIGDSVEQMGVMPVLVIVLLVTAGVIFLTELTSNTATAATFLPVAGGIAIGMGYDPMLLAIPVALAATCAFMLPVATPPNAIAYGSGYVTIGQMVKGGLWLNLFCIVVITAVTMTLAVWIFGLHPGLNP